MVSEALNGLRVAWRNAVLGFLIYLVVTGVLSALYPWSIGQAAAAELSLSPSIRTCMSEFLVLGVAFSVLFAFNLTLVQHLRREYVSRRRQGRI